MNRSRQFCSSAAAESEATCHKYNEDDTAEKQASPLDNISAWPPLDELTPKPVRRQRLHSAESHDSDSSKAASLGCSDSGNYSSASQQFYESTTSNLLRQKDQALFLALQDVRRLRSELERLSKSEKWYKQELRQQKHARLEALEKLYGNERSYIQENQRLQRECLRLYARCGEVEDELEQQRLSSEFEKQQQKQINERLECFEGSRVQDFEQALQRSQLSDQQQLIEVLRKQKRTLLADLKRLNEEKDAQIFELQRNLAQLEADQQRVTTKCKSLLEERSSLESKLKKKSDEIQKQRSEQQEVEEAAAATQIALVEQQRLLKSKEIEIQALECNFKLALREEEEPDAIHQLSVDYHRDIMQKTNEITTLKSALNALQQEIDELSELQSVNEQQQREIEQLQAALAEHDFELSVVEESNAKKSNEILALKAEIAEYQCMARSMEQQAQEKQNGFLAELLRNQEALKIAESELVVANERYASMCEICERTRFTLDMSEIALGKLQFEKCRDLEEVQQLREKLADYLQQTAELSARINEMEIELRKKRESLMLEQATQWELQEVLLHDQENEGEPKNLVIGESKAELEHDEDFANIYQNTQEMHENMKDLDLENLALDGFTQRTTMDESDDGAVTDKAAEIFTTEERLDDFKTKPKMEQETLSKNINEVRNLKSAVEIINEKQSFLESGDEQITAAKIDMNLTKAAVKNENLVTMTKTSLNAMELTNNGSIKAAINLPEEIEQIYFSTSQEDADFQNLNTKLQELHLYIEELKKANKTLKHCMNRDILKESNKALRESGENDNEEKCFLKDADFDHLNVKLQETHAFLKTLQQENLNLKALLAKSLKNFSEIRAREQLEKDKQDKELQANRGKTKNFNEILQWKLSEDERQVKYKNEKELREPERELQNNNNLIENFKKLQAWQPNELQDEDLEEKEQQSEELLVNETLNQKLQEGNNLLAAEIRTVELKQLNDVLQENQENYKNLVKEKQALILQIEEITKLNALTTEAYENAVVELSKAKSQIKSLQLKLLQNDAHLYKLRKAKQLTELEAAGNNYAIEAENKSLFQQLQQMLEKQQALQLKLNQQAQQSNSQREMEQNYLMLQQQLKEVELRLKTFNNKAERAKQNEEQEEKSSEADTQSKPQAATTILAESGHAELHGLREKVKFLEAQLQQADNTDNQHRAERIEMLKQLLEKQSQKVAQLNVAQADWEEMLVQLNTAHAQEAATSAALQQHRIQFEELNARYHEQNMELHMLHQLNLQQNQQQANELLELQQTCQQQRDSLETQATLIESLNSKNKHLEKNTEEDYAQEAGDYKKELRLLRQQVAKLNDEREEFSARMHGMEQELHELRKAKRQAIVMPQIVFPDSDTESQLTAESGGESGRESVKYSGKENFDDHMRLLTKVLENEYKHKMQRYDLHIRTLLGNVNRLKRALSAKEQKVALLQSEQKISTSLERQDLQLTQRQLLETRQRYEQSQHVVKSLELQLAALRQQYEATDAAKSNVHESSHEVANLIDDYKKLINQSAAASKRPKTSVILDLIQRSNQNVPNLNKLESSIVDLRQDIQQYIGASQAAFSLGNSLTHAHSRPSLLDELKLAAVAHS